MSHVGTNLSYHCLEDSVKQAVSRTPYVLHIPCIIMNSSFYNQQASKQTFLLLDLNTRTDTQIDLLS